MEQPVLVMTTLRGVFFGYAELPEDGPMPTELTLRNARMATYWPAENRGVLGLAEKGPVQGARIGPAAPKLRLNSISAICDVTEEAVKRWEAAPWANS